MPINIDGTITSPIMDYVPVVRCKDCKHCYEYYGVLLCKRRDACYGVNDDFFCAWGERREDE